PGRATARPPSTRPRPVAAAARRCAGRARAIPARAGAWRRGWLRAAAAGARSAAPPRRAPRPARALRPSIRRSGPRDGTAARPRALGSDGRPARRSRHVATRTWKPPAAACGLDLVEDGVEGEHHGLPPLLVGFELSAPGGG